MNSYNYVTVKFVPEALIPILDSSLKVGFITNDTKKLAAYLLADLCKRLKLPTDAEYYLNYLLSLSESKLDSVIAQLGLLKLNIDFLIEPNSKQHSALLYYYKNFPNHTSNENVYQYNDALLPKFAAQANYETGFDELEINPNPFDESTVITYKLEEDSFVHLAIYDLLGNEVKTIEKGLSRKGMRKHTIDGKSLLDGFYFLVLQNKDRVISKKVLHLK